MLSIVNQLQISIRKLSCYLVCEAFVNEYRVVIADERNVLCINLSQRFILSSSNHLG